MRRVIRSTVAAILALLGTAVLVVAWTAATAVQLAASALIMGGSFHPLSLPTDDPVGYVTPYLSQAVNEFINPAAAAPAGTDTSGLEGVGPNDRVYAVITPEQFFPVFGSKTLDQSVAAGLVNLTACVRGGSVCIYNHDVAAAPAQPPDPGDEQVIFGYSQSAIIASLLKRDLIAHPGETPTVASFFLLANPMRPNGGVLARGPRGLTIPFLGVTFQGPTPTNSCAEGTCLPTVDVAAQYDGLGGDAPASITNLLAILNAAAGYYYLHGEIVGRSFDDAVYQGSYGDTDYYLYPTKRLPLLMPFAGFVPSPILTALDAPLRAAIEGAYRRDISPGIGTRAGLLPFHHPIQTVINILLAIPVGIDDAFAEATGIPTFRPLGTKPVTSPFGVGGPELPEPPETVTTTTTTTQRSQSADHQTEVVERPDDANHAVVSEDPAPIADEAVVDDPKPVVDDPAPRDDSPVVDDNSADAAEPTTPRADEPDEPKTGEPVESRSRAQLVPQSTGEPTTPTATTNDSDPDDTSHAATADTNGAGGADAHAAA